MKGFVVASHGQLAQGMKNTLSMFFGNVEAMEFLSLSSDESLEGFLKRLKETADRLNDGDGVIIFTDMFGGTPNNCACRLLDKYDVIAGFNLPMLMTFLMHRTDDDFNVKEILDEVKSSLIYVNDVKSDVDDDDF